MLPPLYVRIRGRVQGPFDEAKLRSMVQKGQLSRVHQVSEDGQNWQKASEIRELFMASSTGAEAASVAQAQDKADSNEQSPPADFKDWYFGSGDQPVGPFPLNKIREMVAAGKLLATDIVWKEGMADWVSVDSVPELRVQTQTTQSPQQNQQPVQQQAYSSHYSVASAGQADSTMGGDVSEDIVRPIMAARPWILFFAIAILVLGSLAVIGSIILLLQGFKLGSARMFLEGVSALVWGGIFIVAGIFLFGVTGRSYRLQFEKTNMMVASIMSCYYRFWLFVAITTIVLIAYISLVVFLNIGFPEMFQYY